MDVKTLLNADFNHVEMSFTEMEDINKFLSRMEDIKTTIKLLLDDIDYTISYTSLHIKVMLISDVPSVVEHYVEKLYYGLYGPATVISFYYNLPDYSYIIIEIM